MIVNVFARQNGRTTRTADGGRDELEMSSSVGRSRKKETNKKEKNIFDRFLRRLHEEANAARYTSSPLLCICKHVRGRESRENIEGKLGCVLSLRHWWRWRRADRRVDGWWSWAPIPHWKWQSIYNREIERTEKVEMLKTEKQRADKSLYNDWY